MNRNINFRKTFFVVLAAAVGLGGLSWWLKEKGSGRPAESGVKGIAVQGRGEQVKKTAAKKSVGSKNNSILKSGQVSKDKVSISSDEDAVVVRVLAPIQEDLDSSDPKVIVAAARKIMNHEDPRVRVKAVESLAWAKADGFPDLCKMLLDSDADVARAAWDAWGLQVQSIDSSDAKLALIKEVGKAAMENGADAFQNVLDAMMDVPDAAALSVLQGYADQTSDPQLLEKIYDAVNFRAQPDELVESKDGIPKAIEAFNLRQAQEAAEEAAANK